MTSNTSAAVLLSCLVVAASCGGNSQPDLDDQTIEGLELWLSETPTDQANLEQATYRREVELISECMALQGFEYPYYYEVLVVPEQDSVPDDVEGLGISTRAFPQSTVGPALAGLPDEEWSTRSESDVEEVYLASLTSADQNAYSRSLYGADESNFEWDEGLSEEENRELWSASASEGGCTAEAYSKVLQEFPKLNALESASFLQAEVDAEIDVDSEWVKVQEDVWRCVQERGFDFAVRREVVAYLDDRLSAIYDHASVGDESTSLDQEGLDLLTDLQGEEQDIADAMVVCEADDVSLNNLRDDMRKRLVNQRLGR